VWQHAHYIHDLCAKISPLHPMRTLLKALGISFTGSLPVGIMNMAALQVSITQGIDEAIGFAAAAISIEGLVMFGTGWFAEQLQAWPKAMRSIDRIGAMLLGVIGCMFFARAWYASGVASGVASADPTNNIEMAGWQYGIWLRLLNPTAILFWLGIHLALADGQSGGKIDPMSEDQGSIGPLVESQGTSTRAWKRLVLFAVGGMMGTFGAYSVYIGLAHQLHDFLKPFSTAINVVLGLMCFAAVAWKMKQSRPDRP
jgi:threonine/homoserine/homoserine lactone efflux protein